LLQLLGKFLGSDGAAVFSGERRRALLKAIKRLRSSTLERPRPEGGDPEGPADWSAAAVSKWFAGHGFDDFGAALVRFQFTGKQLLLLDSDRLQVSPRPFSWVFFRVFFSHLFPLQMLGDFSEERRMALEEAIKTLQQHQQQHHHVGSDTGAPRERLNTAARQSLWATAVKAASDLVSHKLSRPPRPLPDTSPGDPTGTTKSELDTSEGTAMAGSGWLAVVDAARAREAAGCGVTHRVFDSADNIYQNAEALLAQKRLSRNPAASGGGGDLALQPNVTEADENNVDNDDEEDDDEWTDEDDDDGDDDDEQLEDATENTSADDADADTVPAIVYDNVLEGNLLPVESPYDSPEALAGVQEPLFVDPVAEPSEWPTVTLSETGELVSSDNKTNEDHEYEEVPRHLPQCRQHRHRGAAHSQQQCSIRTRTWTKTANRR
jgi:hypothetical protein